MAAIAEHAPVGTVLLDDFQGHGALYTGTGALTSTSVVSRDRKLSMTDRLKDRLDAGLAEASEAGRQVVRIDASPADIERLFIKGGERLIFMDADLTRDTAWYREFELRASPEPGTRLLIREGDEEPRAHQI